MKNILTIAFLFGFTAIAMAQNKPQPNDDQLQQQAPRETQKEVERAAIMDARKKEANKSQKRKEARERKKKFLEKHPEVEINDTLNRQKKPIPKEEDQ